MVHGGKHLMVFPLVGLVVIAACAACATHSLPSTMAQLQAGGDTGGRAISTTAAGERWENPNYEIRWKEFRKQARIHHYCFATLSVRDGGAAQ